MLLYFSKKQFDPFCRRERIKFYYGKDQYIVTTVGQLNFFKWALENNIIEYIKNNYANIEYDMNNRNSTSKKKDLKIPIKDKTRKKREELSISASKTIKKEDIEIIVKFD